MKEYTKNIFNRIKNNKLVKIYPKGGKLCIPIILCLFCALLPFDMAAKFMNALWLLLGVITWPFDFMCGYYFCEMFGLI